MVNLNHLYVDGVNIKLGTNESNIDISALLKRLTTINITSSDSWDHGDIKILQQYFTTRLLMTGNLQRCCKFCKSSNTYSSALIFLNAIAISPSTIFFILFSR